MITAREALETAKQARRTQEALDSEQDITAALQTLRTAVDNAIGAAAASGALHVEFDVSSLPRDAVRRGIRALWGRGYETKLAGTDLTIFWG